LIFLEHLIYIDTKTSTQTNMINYGNCKREGRMQINRKRWVGTLNCKDVEEERWGRKRLSRPAGG
jgi:hypothetical protein